MCTGFQADLEVGWFVLKTDEIFLSVGRASSKSLKRVGWRVNSLHKHK